MQTKANFPSNAQCFFFLDLRAAEDPQATPVDGVSWSRAAVVELDSRLAAANDRPGHRFALVADGKHPVWACGNVGEEARRDCELSWTGGVNFARAEDRVVRTLAWAVNLAGVCVVKHAHHGAFKGWDGVVSVGVISGENTVKVVQILVGIDLLLLDEPDKLCIVQRN